MSRKEKYAHNKRPRIGIDLHVADGIFQGSRTHCLELFSRVISLTPECDFFVLAEDSKPLLAFSDSFALPHVFHVSMQHRSAPVRLLGQLPLLVTRHGISLLHTQYITPPILFCATAVTVHDILFESHPQYFERGFVLRSRILVRASVRHSAMVFTVSDFSRREICNRYSVSPKQVYAIPNGADQARFYPGDDGSEVVQALGLKSGDYFLTVGRLEPRKNHAALLRAWALLPIPRPRLVIVGQRHFSYAEVFTLIRSLNLELDVLVLETVSDTQLPSVYRHAKGFIYCSWAEGFGIPLLEAMASGVPVVSSKNSSLTEVGGEAVIWADPGKPEEIARAVTDLDQREDLRRSFIAHGIEQARRFLWDNSAAIVRNVYLDYFGITASKKALGPARPGSDGDSTSG